MSTACILLIAAITAAFPSTHPTHAPTLPPIHWTVAATAVAAPPRLARGQRGAHMTLQRLAADVDATRSPPALQPR